MAAAQRAGIRWPNVCGGQAQCGVCAVEIPGETTGVLPPSARERQMLDRLTVKPRSGGTMRLACQLIITEPMELIKPGVRKPVTPG